MYTIPFDVLVDRSPLAFIIADENGTIEYANQAVQELLEYSREELVGQPVEILIPERFRSSHSGHRIQYMQAPIQRRMGAGRDLVALSRSGREIPVEIGLSPIALGERPLIAVQLIDITTRRQQQEVNDRHARLQSIGFLAGGMAHDFNNILAAISANVDLVSLDGTLSETNGHRLESIRQLLSRGRSLSHKLITFSKGGNPVFRSSNIGKIVQETAEVSAVGSSVLVSVEVPQDLSLAFVDETQISQVITNLMINAVQAMPGGGKVRITCRNLEILESEQPTFLRAGCYVKVVVSDNGPGIPDEIRAKVFEPFFTTKAGGNGLGLAMCHSIIERHGGLLTLQSEVGKGTSFEIYLPADTNSVDGRSPWAPTPAGSCAGSGKVLLMDDERALRVPLASYLRGCGFDVEEAESGEEALGLIRAAIDAKSPFGIVVFDMTIPGKMGGVEAARKAKEYDPNVVVIIMSGYSHETGGPLLDSVAQEYLAKPFRAQELASILRRHLCLS